MKHYLIIILFSIIVFLIIAFSGCLIGTSKFPLSSREKSFIDKRIIGNWELLDTNSTSISFKDSCNKTVFSVKNHLEIMPFNEQEYLLKWYEESDECGFEFHTDYCRGYITLISNFRFFNLQDVKPDMENRNWYFAKYELKNDSTLTMRLVSDSLLHDQFRSSKELRKFFNANKDNKALYEKDQFTYRLVNK